MRMGGYGDDAYSDLIEPELADIVSSTFESLCQEIVPELYSEEQLTQVPSQWWYKDRKIDIVAPTNGTILIVREAKFTNNPLGYNVLATLEDDAPHID